MKPIVRAVNRVVVFGTTALLLFAWLGWATAALAQAPRQLAGREWDPHKTWVFLVGILKWQKQADLESFTATDRKDAILRNVLLKRGVPADHIVYLSDSEGTLHAIKSQLRTLLEKTSPGDFLFAYYCGHGWVADGEAFFGNYDATDDPKQCWSMKQYVHEVINNFHGETALITADCCQSGSIGEEMNRANPMFAWATLTSAVSSESSTSNWTFTSALIDNLEGHRYADYDNNGIITFSELARYITTEMRDLEKQDSSTARSTNFDPNFQIATVQFKNEAIPERVLAQWDDKKWYPAKLVDKNATQGKIHWIDIGWDAPGDDQWIDLKRIKPMKANDANIQPVPLVQKFAVGEHVQIKWQEKWYPGVIRRYKDGTYFVHYDEYPESNNEWVETWQIK